MFRSIVIQGSMVGFWNAMPTRKARAATSRPPTMTTPLDGCTNPLTSLQDGGLAAAGRPDQRDELAIGDPQGRPGERRHRAVAAAEGDRGLGQLDREIGAAEAETGTPENSEWGCMRIMAASACKADASQTRH